MKHLLTLLGSLTMIGGAGATVVACGNKTKAPTPEEHLKKTIDEANNEVKNQEKKWKGKVAQKIKDEIDAAIKAAQEVLEKGDATEEEINIALKKFNDAINQYKKSLPQTIVANAIGIQSADIKYLFDKSWSYSSFFNMDNEKSKDGNLRILDLLYQPVYDLAIRVGYGDIEARDLQQTVLAWSQKNVNLVYLSVDQAGNQQIKEVINNADKDKTLEAIFLDCVKKEFPSEDITTPEFWQTHSKLSLGISFNKNAEGFELDTEIKDFWSFTFAEDLKNKQDTVQRIINLAQERGITFNFEKGLDKETTFKQELIRQFKQIFYGKILVPGEVVLGFTQAPNDKEIAEGISDWHCEDATVRFYASEQQKEAHEVLFEVTASYTIKIA